jgi:tRNA(Phe) wybutosine-synthesizing methylase Tyw3
MDIESNAWWLNKKEELLENIKRTKEIGNTDREVLDIMEDIVKNAKVSKSISDFYENLIEDIE